MKLDWFYIFLDYILKLSFIFIIIYVLFMVVYSGIGEFVNKKSEKTTKYESIKLGDKANKVIVDDVTGCKYIVFNNKTLTPLYDKSGNVEGCGE